MFDSLLWCRDWRTLRRRSRCQERRRVGGSGLQATGAKDRFCGELLRVALGGLDALGDVVLPLALGRKVARALRGPEAIARARRVTVRAEVHAWRATDVATLLDR